MPATRSGAAEASRCEVIEVIIKDDGSLGLFVDRCSYSNEELEAAVWALFQHCGALLLRIEELEKHVGRGAK